MRQLTFQWSELRRADVVYVFVRRGPPPSLTFFVSQMSAPKFKELDETIYDVLEAVRARPTMYIPEPSIKQLRAFLDGYTGGLGRVRYALRGEGLRRFNEWIARRLGFAEPTSGWCNMIRAKSLSDEDAFNRFFLLLDEFGKEPA